MPTDILNLWQEMVTPYESEPVTTYHIRDAQGNLMATHEVKIVEEEGDWFFLKDQYLYGSSRLCSYTADTAALPQRTHSDSNRYERVIVKYTRLCHNQE